MNSGAGYFVAGPRTLLTSLLPALLFAGMLTVIACGSSSGPEDTRDEALEEYLTGLDLQDRGNLSAAFDAYNKALRLDPRLDQAYAARGHIYYLYNDLTSALADLNRAVDLNSEHAVAYYYRGLVFDAASSPTIPS